MSALLNQLTRSNATVAIASEHLAALARMR
jgi:hypothetical protein